MFEKVRDHLDDNQDLLEKYSRVSMTLLESLAHQKVVVVISL
jgi:hypothetical protein